MESSLEFSVNYLHAVSEQLERVTRRICLHLRNEDEVQLSTALAEAKELIDLADRLHQQITETIGRMPADDPLPRDAPQSYIWPAAP